MELVTSSVLEPIISKILKRSRSVVLTILKSDSIGREMKEKLSQLRPAINEALELSSDAHMKDLKTLLDDGLKIVAKLERVGYLNFYRRYLYAAKIIKFGKRFAEFLDNQGRVNSMLNQHRLNRNVEKLLELESLNRPQIESIYGRLSNNSASNAFLLQNVSSHEQISSDGGYSYGGQTEEVVDPPEFVVGLKKSVHDLKRLLLRKDVNCIAVNGMGGCGKTTVAKVLCTDAEIKYQFGKVVFIYVSKAPNLMSILEIIWNKLVHRVCWPKFNKEEEAIEQLRFHLKSRITHPTLLVFDDVWERATMECLLLNIENYKTIITTRYEKIIPKKNGVHLYKLPFLEGNDALSLFCHWAFGGSTSIPDGEDDNLVLEVVKECKGLPLALKVIGSYLHGEPLPAWERAKNKLRRSESISDCHKDRLLDCLEESINVIRDDEVKQCFLDLGAFPKGQKFSVDALLNIWVYVHGLDWKEGFAILLELASRNLVNLIKDPGTPFLPYNCAGDLYFSQHDVMRDLAWHLANKDKSSNNNGRLFISRKENGLPRSWIMHQEQTSTAQFVSIHTGAMEKDQWPNVVFPEAKVLALFFSESQYYLPQFLNSMPNLKVLILHNYGPKRATLNGISGLGSLDGIKFVFIEKIVFVPEIYEHCKTRKSLEKFSISLCECHSELATSNNEPEVLFPNLVEMKISYCTGLKELPEELCGILSLQMLCISYCDDIQSLPESMDRLRSLKVLRLSACTCLQKLPSSISRLCQLEFLDISFSSSLKDLGLGFSHFKKLRFLDMRACFGLSKALKNVSAPTTLERVICYESDASCWRSIKPNASIKVAKEPCSIDWVKD